MPLLNYSCWMVPTQLLEKMFAGLPAPAVFCCLCCFLLVWFFPWLTPCPSSNLDLLSPSLDLQDWPSCFDFLLTSLIGVPTKNHSDMLFMLLCYWQKAWFPLLCALYLSYATGGGWEPARVWHGMSPVTCYCSIDFVPFHFHSHLCLMNCWQLQKFWESRQQN